MIRCFDDCLFAVLALLAVPAVLALLALLAALALCAVLALLALLAVLAFPAVLAWLAAVALFACLLALLACLHCWLACWLACWLCWLVCWCCLLVCIQLGWFEFSGPYYQSNNCLIQGTFMSELLEMRLRKATVELLTGLSPRSLVAPSSRGRPIYRHIVYMYILHMYLQYIVYIHIYREREAEWYATNSRSFAISVWPSSAVLWPCLLGHASAVLCHSKPWVIKCHTSGLCVGSACYCYCSWQLNFRCLKSLVVCEWMLGKHNATCVTGKLRCGKLWNLQCLS